MKKYQVFLLTLTLGFALNAQNTKDKAAEILGNVNAFLNKASSVSMSVTHRFYSAHDDANPSDIYRGYYKKSKEKVHSSLMGIETYENKEMKISVDTSNASVVLSGITPAIGPVPDFKTSLSFCSKVTVEAKDSGVQEIQLWFDAAKYPMERVILQVKNNIITKLVLYHSETIEDESGKVLKPKTEIVFSNIKTEGHISSSEFDFSPIVKRSSGQYVLTPAYHQYKLINLIPKN